jgi:hypothetical protein
MDIDYVTKTELIQERGWTRTLIERFLPRPDATRENPHHPRGACMKLYDMNRVERVEELTSFRKMLASVNRRRRRGRTDAEPLA